jgi:GNAT superfamily N-acetyltransferase
MMSWVRESKTRENWNLTKPTDKFILDKFSNRIRDFHQADFLIRVERTKGSYKVVSYKNGKSVGRIYIQQIKETPRGYKAELRRLNVNNEYRSKGLGRILLETAIDTFKDIDLYGYASPNRFNDLTEDNREEYREGLKKFYESVGLKSVGNGHKVEKIHCH